MQFIYVATTIVLLLSICLRSNSYRLEPEWLYIEPSDNKDGQVKDNNEEQTTKETNASHYIKVHAKNRDKAYNTDQVYPDNDSKYNGGIRKKHTYKHLRKMQRFKREFEFNDDTDTKSDNSVESASESQNYFAKINVNDKLKDIIQDDPEAVVGEALPGHIFKIRLSLLQKLLENHKRHVKRFEALNFEDTDESDDKEAVPEYPVIESIVSPPEWRVDPGMRTIYITRGRLPSSTSTLLHDLDRKHTPHRSKRIFTFLTRVQGMHSPKDWEHRRHFYHPSFDSNGDIVSAETRALIRPPGSPLRWG